jgi:hypothetical protein
LPHEGDRLARNDPQGVAPSRRRLDSAARCTLGTAAGTLSNTLDAAAWLRERSAALPTQMLSPPNRHCCLIGTASSAPASVWPRSTVAAER